MGWKETTGRGLETDSLAALHGSKRGPCLTWRDHGCCCELSVEVVLTGDWKM